MCAPSSSTAETSPESQLVPGKKNPVLSGGSLVTPKSSPGNGRGLGNPSPMGLFGLSLAREDPVETSDLKNPWRWGL